MLNSPPPSDYNFYLNPHDLFSQVKNIREFLKQHRASIKSENKKDEFDWQTSVKLLDHFCTKYNDATGLYKGQSYVFTTELPDEQVRQSLKEHNNAKDKQLCFIVKLPDSEKSKAKFVVYNENGEPIGSSYDKSAQEWMENYFANKQIDKECKFIEDNKDINELNKALERSKLTDAEYEEELFKACAMLSDGAYQAKKGQEFIESPYKEYFINVMLLAINARLEKLKDFNDKIGDEKVKEKISGELRRLYAWIAQIESDDLLSNEYELPAKINDLWRVLKDKDPKDIEVQKLFLKQLKTINDGLYEEYSEEMMNHVRQNDYVLDKEMADLFFVSFDFDDQDDDKEDRLLEKFINNTTEMATKLEEDKIPWLVLSEIAIKIRNYGDEKTKAVFHHFINELSKLSEQGNSREAVNICAKMIADIAVEGGFDDPHLLPSDVDDAVGKILEDEASLINQFILYQKFHGDAKKLQKIMKELSPSNAESIKDEYQLTDREYNLLVKRRIEILNTMGRNSENLFDFGGIVEFSDHRDKQDIINKNRKKGKGVFYYEDDEGNIWGYRISSKKDETSDLCINLTKQLEYDPDKSKNSKLSMMAIFIDQSKDGIFFQKESEVPEEINTLFEEHSFSSDIEMVDNPLFSIKTINKSEIIQKDVLEYLNEKMGGKVSVEKITIDAYSLSNLDEFKSKYRKLSDCSEQQFPMLKAVGKIYNEIHEKREANKQSYKIIRKPRKKKNKNELDAVLDGKLYKEEQLDEDDDMYKDHKATAHGSYQVPEYRKELDISENVDNDLDEELYVKYVTKGEKVIPEDLANNDNLLDEDDNDLDEELYVKYVTKGEKVIPESLVDNDNLLDEDDDLDDELYVKYKTKGGKVVPEGVVDNNNLLDEDDDLDDELYVKYKTKDGKVVPEGVVDNNNLLNEDDDLDDELYVKYKTKGGKVVPEGVVNNNDLLDEDDDLDDELYVKYETKGKDATCDYQHVYALIHQAINSSGGYDKDGNVANVRAFLKYFVDQTNNILANLDDGDTEVTREFVTSFIDIAETLLDNDQLLNNFSPNYVNSLAKLNRIRTQPQYGDIANGMLDALVSLLQTEQVDFKEVCRQCIDAIDNVDKASQRGDKDIHKIPLKEKGPGLKKKLSLRRRFSLAYESQEKEYRPKKIEISDEEKEKLEYNHMLKKLLNKIGSSELIDLSYLAKEVAYDVSTKGYPEITYKNIDGQPIVLDRVEIDFLLKYEKKSGNMAKDKVAKPLLKKIAEGHESNLSKKKMKQLEKPFFKLYSSKHKHLPSAEIRRDIFFCLMKMVDQKGAEEILKNFPKEYYNLLGHYEKVSFLVQLWNKLREKSYGKLEKFYKSRALSESEYSRFLQSLALFGHEDKLSAFTRSLKSDKEALDLLTRMSKDIEQFKGFQTKRELADMTHTFANVFMALVNEKPEMISTIINHFSKDGKFHELLDHLGRSTYALLPDEVLAKMALTICQNELTGRVKSGAALRFITALADHVQSKNSKKSEQVSRSLAKAITMLNSFGLLEEVLFDRKNSEESINNLWKIYSSLPESEKMEFIHRLENSSYDSDYRKIVKGFLDKYKKEDLDGFNSMLNSDEQQAKVGEQDNSPELIRQLTGKIPSGNALNRMVEELEEGVDIDNNQYPAPSKVMEYINYVIDSSQQDLNNPERLSNIDQFELLKTLMHRWHTLPEGKAKRSASQQLNSTDFIELLKANNPSKQMEDIGDLWIPKGGELLKALFDYQKLVESNGAGNKIKELSNKISQILSTIQSNQARNELVRQLLLQLPNEYALVVMEHLDLASLAASIDMLGEDDRVYRQRCIDLLSQLPTAHGSIEKMVSIVDQLLMPDSPTVILTAGERTEILQKIFNNLSRKQHEALYSYFTSDQFSGDHMQNNVEWMNIWLRVYSANYSQKVSKRKDVFDLKQLIRKLRDDTRKEQNKIVNIELQNYKEYEDYPEFEDDENIEELYNDPKQSSENIMQLNYKADQNLDKPNIGGGDFFKGGQFANFAVNLQGACDRLIADRNQPDKDQNYINLYEAIFQQTQKNGAATLDQSMLSVLAQLNAKEMLNLMILSDGILLHNQVNLIPSERQHLEAVHQELSKMFIKRLVSDLAREDYPDRLKDIDIRKLGAVLGSRNIKDSTYQECGNEIKPSTLEFAGDHLNDILYKNYNNNLQAWKSCGIEDRLKTMSNVSQQRQQGLMLNLD